MMMTLGAWIAVGVIALAGVGFSIMLFINEGTKEMFCALGVTVVVCAMIIFGCNWYYKNTASGARAYKDFVSDFNNGIERSLDVVANDGTIIYHREGKFDLEVHDDYIVFDENHERTILYRSYTSTLVIEEKAVN